MKFIVEVEDSDCEALQKAASKTYPQLKDHTKFVEWIEEYMQGSFGELIEEHIEEEE